jgi:hypothetical protein
MGTITKTEGNFANLEHHIKLHADFFNKALQDLPEYVGIPVHDAGTEGSGVPAASFCVHTTMTIKITKTV